MKIKSSEYWRLLNDLEAARDRIQGQEDIAANVRLGAIEWRAKYERLAAGGVDEKLEREKAFERGRQLGVMSVRGSLIDALEKLTTTPEPAPDTAQKPPAKP